MTSGHRGVSPQDVAANAGETMKPAETLAKESRDRFLKNLDEQVSQFDRRADALRQKSAELRDDAATKWRESWDELQSRRETLTSRIHDVKSSGDDAWVDLRDGVTSAWSELQSSFEKTQSHFSQP